MMIWRKKTDHADYTKAIPMGSSSVVINSAANRVFITVANDGRTVTVAEIEQNPLVISCIDMTREEFDENFECMANVKARRES